MQYHILKAAVHWIPRFVVNQTTDLLIRLKHTFLVSHSTKFLRLPSRSSTNKTVWHFHSHFHWIYLQVAFQIAADSSGPAREVWLWGHLQEAQQGGRGDSSQQFIFSKNTNIIGSKFWWDPGSKQSCFLWRILLKVGAEWKLVLLQYALYLNTVCILNICIKISSKLDIEQ